jgi:hypothetical protein
MWGWLEGALALGDSREERADKSERAPAEAGPRPRMALPEETHRGSGDAEAK